MQHYKIFKLTLFLLFFLAVTQSSYSKNTNFSSISGISQDSISKSEIAEFRKSFESVEKMINRKSGSYADAKRSLDALRGSRVRGLPEFAGRFNSAIGKLSDWDKEVNPKQPPVVVPNNPNPTNPPKNTGKATEKIEEKPMTETQMKSLMLSYFPDTITVGTDFIAYLEIAKDNNMQTGNQNNNVNSGTEIITLSSSNVKSAIMSSLVSVELMKDGGVDNFSINPRSDRTKIINDNERARWEWLIHPNSEGESRLRLSVTYQKQNADGTVQQVSAANKVIVLKALPRKEGYATNYLLWGGLALVVIFGLIGYIIYTAQKNKKAKRQRNAEYKI